MGGAPRGMARHGRKCDVYSTSASVRVPLRTTRPGRDAAGAGGPRGAERSIVFSFLSARCSSCFSRPENVRACVACCRARRWPAGRPAKSPLLPLGLRRRTAVVVPCCRDVMRHACTGTARRCVARRPAAAPDDDAWRRQRRRRRSEGNGTCRLTPAVELLLGRPARRHRQVHDVDGCSSGFRLFGG